MRCNTCFDIGILQFEIIFLLQIVSLKHIIMTIKNTYSNIEVVFTENKKTVENFFYLRVKDRMEAEDLTQDLFIKLLDYDKLLRPETVKSFIFTIARNMVIDYYRHFYRRQDAEEYLLKQERNTSYEIEQKIIVRDIENYESKRLSLFPSQRKMIYSLNRYKEYSVNEIAQEMSISKRTVENHLRLGRKEMREYLLKTL